MSWSKEATIVTHNGHDYWRTWFIEECEKSGLFGVNEKHIDLLMHPSLGYTVGIRIFLEDAPYFKATGSTHRICGPYEVVPAVLTEGSKVIYESRAGDLILYKEAFPEKGPWLDRAVTRVIDGTKVRIQQKASEFKFYPYRFAIRKSSAYKVDHVRHDHGCWLCR